MTSRRHFLKLCVLSAASLFCPKGALSQEQDFQSPVPENVPIAPEDALPQPSFDTLDAERAVWFSGISHNQHCTEYPSTPVSPFP